jgi:hypothetical protein
VAEHPLLLVTEPPTTVDSKYPKPEDVDVDVALPVEDGIFDPLSLLLPSGGVAAAVESVEGSTQVKEGLPFVSATVVRSWPVAQIGSVMQ